MGLEKGRIVETALALLDEVGLDGLTLRKLAAELGVQAPALYWHFKSKQELLDAMAAAMLDAKVARRPLDDPAQWRAWLAEFARGERATLNSRRDGARLAAGTRPSPELFEAVESMIETLEGSGFSDGDAMRGIFTLSSFVAGFVLEEQADRMRPDSGTEHPDLALVQASYPRLMGALMQVGDPQGDASFEAGVAMILDGMERRLGHL